MKSRVAGGGVLVVVAAMIVSWFSGLFSGGGGEGVGIPANRGTSEPPSAETPQEPEAVHEEASPAPEPLDGVVDVWIHDRQYEIRSAASDGTGQIPQRKVVPLETVVERAQAASGNVDGIRVRIIRDASSRASAEQALQTALESAGLPEHSLRWTSSKPAE